MQINKRDFLIPSKECWGDFGADPDLAAVAELFLGKNKEAVVSLLERNFIIRCLDLRVMPDCAFEYYASVFAEFVACKVSTDERFGIMLGAFLDAMSSRRASSPLLWLEFWRVNSFLFDQLIGRLGRCEMDLETMRELKEDLDEIHAATQK